MYEALCKNEQPGRKVCYVDLKDCSKRKRKDILYYLSLAA